MIFRTLGHTNRLQSSRFMKKRKQNYNCSLALYNIFLGHPVEKRIFFINESNLFQEYSGSQNPPANSDEEILWSVSPDLNYDVD